LMMVRECTGTCYVLFLIVVVSTSDPKDLLVKCVTMFTTQSTWLIWVGLGPICLCFLFVLLLLSFWKS
jgi:hypothetical protein